MRARFQELVGNAILGIDTLWGGDVMCASGVGRFIADRGSPTSRFARRTPTQPRHGFRASGGVSAKAPDRKAIQAYLERVDILGAIRALKTETPRSDYLAAALCFETMWNSPWRSWMWASRSLRPLRTGLHRPGAGTGPTLRQTGTRSRVAGPGRVPFA